MGSRDGGLYDEGHVMDWLRDLERFGVLRVALERGGVEYCF